MTRLRRVAFGLPTHHPIFGSDPHMSSISRRGSLGRVRRPGRRLTYLSTHAIPGR
jgi:hypothetical protein